MQRNDIIAKQGQEMRPPIGPAAHALVLLAWALLLVLLAAGMLVAPTRTIYAIATVGLGVPLLWLVWNHPELGLLALICLTSNLLPADSFELRLFFGGLDSRDLVLLGMFGILILQGMLGKRSLRLWLPVSGPLLIFLGLAIFSALDALLYRGGEFNWTLGELRTLCYYSIFFVAAWAINARKQIAIVLLGLFLLSDFIALILILQQFLGMSDLLLQAMMFGNTWLVWQAGDPSITFGGVRIIPPGHVLMYLMSIIAFSLMVFGRQPGRLRVFFALQFVWINWSLLLTYARAQWIASTIALLLITMLTNATDRFRIVRLVLTLTIVIWLIHSLFRMELQETLDNSTFANLLINRAGSIFTPEETLDTYSLEWRIFEIGEALHAISEHPLLGVGLGNPYREPTLLHDEAGTGYFRLTRFVHNSYLYLAVKMGVLGLLAFAGFVLAFIVSGWRAYRRIRDEQYKRITLAILASFVGLLGWSITQAHLLQTESTAVVGLMAGLLVCMRQLDAAQAQAGATLLTKWPAGKGQERPQTPPGPSQPKDRGTAL